jgi:cyclic pyranopterin phosphate synthase
MGQIDERGHIKMVDVTEKRETHRTARAHARIFMKKEALNAITGGNVEKGDVLTSAKIAGILAAKKTGELIPLCHPLNITFVDVQFKINEKKSFIEIESFAELVGKTGVEMEAMVAATNAALTIYDMCKSMDKEMLIDEIYLIEKTGGKSGHFVRKIKK